MSERNEDQGTCGKTSNGGGHLYFGKKLVILDLIAERDNMSGCVRRRSRASLTEYDDSSIVLPYTAAWCGYASWPDNALTFPENAAKHRTDSKKADFSC